MDYHVFLYLRYKSRPSPKTDTFRRKNQIAKHTTMKFLIALSALAAVAFANPGLAPLGYAAYPGAHSYSYSSFGFAGVPTAYSYNSFAPAVAAAPVIAKTYAAPAVVAAPVVAKTYAAPAVVAAPVVAKTYAAPAVVAAPVVAKTYAAAPAIAVAGIKTQYHAQDGHGQASYGHSEPFQSHNAVQDAHGNKVGSFSYVAPSGQVFRTDYVADALGYRVSSNALPVGPSHPVADTPEVAAAKAAHLAHFRGKRGIAAVAVGHTPASTSPLGAGIPAPITYAAPIAYASPIAYVAPHAAYTYFH